MIPAPDKLVPLNDVVPAQIGEVVITGAAGVVLTVTGEEAKLKQPEAVAVAVIEFVATKAGETVIVHEVPLAVPDPICDAPA